MKDPYPWYTRVGLVIFVVLPLVGLYHSRRAKEPPRPSAYTATKKEKPVPQPIKTRRPKVVTVSDEPYRLKEPPEQIGWYAAH